MPPTETKGRQLVTSRMCRVLTSALLLGGILYLTPRLATRADADAEASRGDQPTVLIDSIVVLTPFFSPNKDGLLDTAEFRYLLSNSAQVFIHVSNVGAADTVEILADTFLVDTRVTYNETWDGTDRDDLAAPEGVYDVVFSATDTTGVSQVNQRQVRLDVTAPAVEILAIHPRPFTPTLPGSAQRIRVRLGISLSDLMDELGVEIINGTDTLGLEIVDVFSGDGEYVAVCENCAQNSVLSDGMHRIVAFAQDLAGNSSLDADSLDKNVIGPDITRSHPLRAAVQHADSLVGLATDRQFIPAVSLVISGPIDTLTVSLPPRDATADTSYPFFLDISQLLRDEGQYGLQLLAVDADSVADTLAFQLQVDRTAPSVPMLAPPPGPVSKLQFIDVTVTVDSTSNRIVRSGGASAPDTVNATTRTVTVRNIRLAPGANLLAFSALDRAGNASGSVTADVTWETSEGIAAPERFRAGNEIHVHVGDRAAMGVVVRILALDGGLVRRFENNASELVYRFPWDLRNDQGSTVKNGAYMVLVRVHRSDGGDERRRKMIAVIQ